MVGVRKSVGVGAWPKKVRPSNLRVFELSPVEQCVAKLAERVDAPASLVDAGELATAFARSRRTEEDSCSPLLASGTWVHRPVLSNCTYGRNPGCVSRTRIGQVSIAAASLRRSNVLRGVELRWRLAHIRRLLETAGGWEVSRWAGFAFSRSGDHIWASRYEPGPWSPTLTRRSRSDPKSIDFAMLAKPVLFRAISAEFGRPVRCRPLCEVDPLLRAALRQLWSNLGRPRRT